MPSSTDSDPSDLAGTTLGDPGTPSVGSASGRERGPVWPITALVVLLGWCLLAWTVLVAGINTAPFFGEIPSRDRYLESGMVALTALLPLSLVLVLGVLLGSRWGLALLALPALLLVPLGLDLLDGTGDPTKPGYGRGPGWDDVFADATRTNWVATAVLLVALGAVVWRRRRQSGTRARP